MSDLPPAPDPAAVPPPPASAPSGDGASAGKPPEPPPRKRGWFVVLAWVTLIGFGIFTAAITVLSIALPAIAARGR